MGFVSNAFNAVKNFLVPSKVDAVTGAAPRAFSGVSGNIDSGLVNHHPYSQVGQIIPGSSGFSKLVSSAKDTVGTKLSGLGSTGSASGGNGGGSGTAAAVPVSDQYDYYNAKLASIYGMDAETAYQEALSNTSYQRAVEDLKAAGLNPVLAAGKVSGADSFYGTLGSSSGSSGFSGGRSYSGASSGKSGLQSALKDYNVRSGVSSVVSGITTAVTKNFQAGAAAYYFSNAILNAVSKR